MQVEIVYPVVISKKKVIDIPEEKFVEIQNMNLEDKAMFIIDLNDDEVHLTGSNLISQALDIDMAWIREVK